MKKETLYKRTEECPLYPDKTQVRFTYGGIEYEVKEMDPLSVPPVDPQKLPPCMAKFVPIWYKGAKFRGRCLRCLTEIDLGPPTKPWLDRI